MYLLRRLQDDADARGDEALGPALRPDRAVRPLRAGERRASCTSRSGGTRSRRCGAASGRRRAATGSSCRPTSTWSTADTLPFHYDTEMPLVIGDALGGAADPAGRGSRSTTASCAEGFYRGLGSPTPARCCAPIDKLDKIGPDKVAALLVETAGATDAQAAGLPRAGRDLGATDASFVDAVRALGVSDPLLDEGLERAGPGGRDGRREHAPGLARGRAEDRPRPRLLHRHGLRDPAGRLRAARLDLLRRPLRQPGHRRATDRYPGRGHLHRRLPDARAAVRPRTRWPCPGRCRPACWSRCRPTRTAPSCDRIADGAAPAAASPTEVAPTAAKFGKQIRFADRRGIPYVWFPASRDEVKDIRSGEQVPADAATWEPAAADRAPQVSAG